MTIKYFICNFKIFNIVLFCVAQTCAMKDAATYVTDLVQISKTTGGEFINRSDLINKYKKYSFVNNSRQLYQPHTWTHFTQIPQPVRQGIIKDYYNTMAYALLQDPAGQEFLLHFKNYYKTRSKNMPTDFEILKSNFQEIVCIKKLYEIIKVPDVFNIIWSLLQPQLKQEFAVNIEDIWSRQLMAGDLWSDISTPTSLTTSAQYDGPLFDAVTLHGYTIAPFYIKDLEGNRFKIISPEGTPSFIDVVGHKYDIPTLWCLHGSMLGCASSFSFSAYDIQTGREPVTYYKKNEQVRACDMAHDLIALLIGEKEHAQKIVILSAITNRILFSSNKWFYMSLDDRARFKITLHIKNGNVVVRGDTFSTLESPFNPFEILARLQSNEKISLMEYVAARYAADLVRNRI